MDQEHIVCSERGFNVFDFRAIRRLAATIVLFSLGGSRVGHALTFRFDYVDDPSMTFASRGWLDSESLFQKNIRAAADFWGEKIASSAEIVVRVDTTSFAARAGGAFSFGRLLRTNAEGKQVWETGPLTRILTGDNPGENFFGYDIVLGFDAQFVENFYWFDPDPLARIAPVPANRGDFVSVVMHELGHGFGMAGNRNFNTGEISGSVASQFDDLSSFGGDGNPFNAQGAPNPLFFDGPMAVSQFGGAVPLTHKPTGHPNFGQNFYHWSACDSGDPDGLEESLMNGCVLPNGRRLDILPIDAALLADLGYPMAVSLTADFNGDGAVNAHDLNAWQAAYGVSANADADEDGDSDGDDFLQWQIEFGSGLLTMAAGGSVPEPKAIQALLGSLLVAALWGGRLDGRK